MDKSTSDCSGNVEQAEHTRQDVVRRFAYLYRQALKKGISAKDARNVFLDRSKQAKLTLSRPSMNTKKCNRFSIRSFVTLIVLAGLSMWVTYRMFPNLPSVRSYEDLEQVMEQFYWSKCLINNVEEFSDFCRPVMDCKFCKNVTSVPIESDITRDRFRKLYAYSSRPVLIKGATRNWTAMTTFNFTFFKDLYEEEEGAYESVSTSCQFFPYKTTFESLEEVFEMPEARATFQPGQAPWYIGWSNCNKQVQKRLREHYQRPYFLPNDSESSVIDWMFMGGSGPGAFVHLDYVQRPSWQAQISGRKTWTLVPAPECEATCHSMNVTVEKGDIFVIDTNVWYHSTFIHPGEISITIGSEYD